MLSSVGVVVAGELLRVAWSAGRETRATTPSGMSSADGGVGGLFAGFYFEQAVRSRLGAAGPGEVDQVGADVYGGEAEAGGVDAEHLLHEPRGGAADQPWAS